VVGSGCTLEVELMVLLIAWGWDRRRNFLEMHPSTFKVRAATSGKGSISDICPF
jgi:hypothetical protein